MTNENGILSYQNIAIRAIPLAKTIPEDTSPTNNPIANLMAKILTVITSRFFVYHSLKCPEKSNFPIRIKNNAILIW